MPVAPTDLKYYLADAEGNIDLNSEFADLVTIFQEVFDADGDQEVKVFLKNEHATDSFGYGKIYGVNGYTINNTNGEPIVEELTECYSHFAPGIYSLTHPASNSVIVTPPSNIARAAQTISKDGETVNFIYLEDNLNIGIVFDSGLTTAMTSTITISSGGSLIWLAEDVANAPDEYAQRFTYEDGLDVGTLTAGSTYAFWIKQVAPIGSGDSENDLIWIPVLLGRPV